MTEAIISQAEKEKQIEVLYAKLGRIAVLSEHLNHAMHTGCLQILLLHGLDYRFASIVLVGQNLENMRRTWESLMKAHYEGNTFALDAINNLSQRLEKVIKRRNDTIHTRWMIGWGNEQSESYAAAESMKEKRDIGRRGTGFTKLAFGSTEDFDETISQLEVLASLVGRLMGCAIGNNSVQNNFGYDAEGNLTAPATPAATNP